MKRSRYLCIVLAVILFLLIMFIRELLQLSSSAPGRSDDNTKLVILIIISIGVCLMLVASTIIILKRRRKQEIELQNAGKIISVESLRYDFGKIRAATSDFDDANKLGRGRFGTIYWGKLEDGQEIAAKILSKDSGQEDIEFMNEVLLLARLQHRNLVKLLGFSLEGTERILVYEYVHNGSLDKFIFDPIRRSELGWDGRYKIIEGVARGILYLHDDFRLVLLHRDLNASNILLDGDMKPKITELGVAKLFRQDETQENTSRAFRSYEFLSASFKRHKGLCIRSDIFSFGVLILEIISGRRNNMEDLLSLTWENWQGGTIVDMIDPVLRNDKGSIDEMLKCIHIGLLCVQENVYYWPSMTVVVYMLTSLTTAKFDLPGEPASYKASRNGSNVPLVEENDLMSSSSLNNV